MLLPRPPCGVWWWLDATTGERRDFACGSWKCPVCGYANARRWVRLLREAPIQRHLVFTRLAGEAEEARARLRNIIKGIRRGEAHELDAAGHRRSIVFEYFGTMEKHQSAGVHIHLLQWGNFVPQALLSALLDRYGAGRVCWAERIADIPTDKLRALCRYVTAHLVTLEHPFQPKTGRKVRYSRHFWAGRSTAEVRQQLLLAAGHEPTEPGTWALQKVPYTRS